MKPKPRRKSRDISHCDPCYISFLVSIVGYPDVVIWAVVDTCFRLFFFFRGRWVCQNVVSFVCVVDDDVVINEMS